MWLPSTDVRPAEEFGELRIMFDMRASRISLDKMCGPLAAHLSDFQPDDYLVALGDPSLIAMSAAFIGIKHSGKFQLLTWDRFARKYIRREIDLGYTKN